MLENKPKGILEALTIEADDAEVEAIFESVLDFALESAAKKRILTPKQRDALPDSAFGVVVKDKEGNKIRKYPLIVKGDPKITEELIGRSIEYFHFCKPPEWKPMLAKNIIKAMNTTGVIVKIHPRNQINKYVNVPDKYVAADTKDKYQDKEH